MKRLFALLLLAMFSMSALTACNTMAGAGKDVQKVGEKVEDKAQDCKDGKCRVTHFLRTDEGGKTARMRGGPGQPGPPLA